MDGDARRELSAGRDESASLSRSPRTLNVDTVSLPALTAISSECRAS